MPLTLDLPAGRDACAESIGAFLGAVADVPEYDLLAMSRCHGWSRLDVISHVIAGWEDMLGGLVSPVERPATVDAASYWTAFGAEYADVDPVATLMSQRRRTAAYARPSSALAHLRDVGEALLRGVDALGDHRYLWQGHVFTAGDFLTVWAVENVVHQLDLLLEGPVPSAALTLARRTVDALAGPLPDSWDDTEAVLIGTGRLPVPADAGDDVATRLPALS